MTQYNADFDETKTDISNIISNNGFSFDQNLSLKNDIFWNLGISVRESFIQNDEITSGGIFLLNLSDKLNMKDVHSFAFLANFIASANFTGNSDVDRNIVVSFVEAVYFSSAIESMHKAMANIAESLVEMSDVSTGLGFDFLNAINIDANEDFSFSLVMNALEGVIFLGDVEFSAGLFFGADEGINIDDSLDSKGTLVGLFDEGLFIGGLLNTPEGLFEAWVVNAETGAPFKYTNFPFNSFATTKGKYYGADEDGLFELDGDDDDGKDIDSAIKTGIINFGTTLFKRIPRAYFGYSADGLVLFNTVSTESGQKVERWYELKEKIADETTNSRVKMARGVKSVHWQFEIINVKGSSFNFNDIKLMPAILKRRR